MNEEQANQKFTSILEKGEVDENLGFFKVYDENDNLLGDCKLVYNKHIENSLEIGYLLKKEFWRKGFGLMICEHLLAESKEKFPDLQVMAVIDPDNVASRKLLEKFNFESYWKGIENDLPTEKLLLKREMIPVKDVALAMEEIAPLAYAEDFDNVGLLVGDYNDEVTGILVTLDTTPEVVEEAD